MYNIKKRLILIIVLGINALAVSANAATYYVVDGVGESCSDSNAGSEGSPWCRCPQMEDWSGTAVLAAGDIVYFESDGTWNHDALSSYFFLWIEGGVQYIGDEWGSGTRARFTMDTAFSCPPASNQHPIIAWYEDDEIEETVFKGFEIDLQEQCATGIGVNFQGVFDGRSDGHLTGATKRIENCYVHHQYNQGSYNYSIIVATGPYYCGDPVNNRMGLSPLTNYPCGWDVSNIEILNNIVTNTGRDAILLYPGNSVYHIDNVISDVLIRGNHVSYVNCDALPCGSHQKDPTYTAGSAYNLKNRSHNVTVECNVAEYCFNSGFVANADPPHTHSATNIVCRYNLFKDLNGFGYKIKGPGGKSIDIYGNIIINANTAGMAVGIEGFADDLDMKVYNNIFYEPSGVAVYIESNAGNINTLEFKNNLIYAASGLSLWDQDGDITAHNNNLYYRVGGGNLINSAGSNYTSLDLASYEPTALSSDPLFVDISNLPTDFTGIYGVDMRPNTEGMSLQSPSLAIDAGENLGSGYNGSINSAIRPQGPAWDIGAYEYVSGISLTGDLNADGAVNTEDIQLCVNVILGTETTASIVSRADVNEDGNVNVRDVQEIVNIILE